MNTGPLGPRGAIQLLAQLLASIDDPHDLGVGAEEIGGDGRSVRAVVHLPSGDSYRVIVEWLGDRETV